MAKIQLITDGHPNNTTLIIDGVDVTSEYDVGWITIEAFGRDPLELKLPYFKLQYSIIENNPLDQKIIETAKKENVNMIIGGPPCQGFSLKGKKLGINDPRNFLFLEYVKMVEEIKPEIFIIENVKNMIMTNNSLN